jgi:hypothetical protein
MRLVKKIAYFSIIISFFFVIIIQIFATKNWSDFIYFDGLIKPSNARVLYLKKSLFGLNDIAIVEFTNTDIADKVWLNLNSYDEEINTNIVFNELNKKHVLSKNFVNNKDIKFINFKNENGYLVYTTTFIRSEKDRRLYMIKLRSKK